MAIIPDVILASVDVCKPLLSYIYILRFKSEWHAKVGTTVKYEINSIIKYVQLYHTDLRTQKYKINFYTL